MPCLLSRLLTLFKYPYLGIDGHTCNGPEATKVSDNSLESKSMQYIPTVKVLNLDKSKSQLEDYKKCKKIQ